jgi:hypothetical protein
MVYRCVIVVILLLGMGCAGDYNAQWKDEVLKDWRGDNMQMRTSRSMMEEMRGRVDADTVE